jgi:hypothetical protein
LRNSKKNSLVLGGLRGFGVYSMKKQQVEGGSVERFYQNDKRNEFTKNSTS